MTVKVTKIPPHQGVTETYIKRYGVRLQDSDPNSPFSCVDDFMDRTRFTHYPDGFDPSDPNRFFATSDLNR